MFTTRLVGCLALVLMSCGTDAGSPSSGLDRPGEWREATSAGLTQSDCTGPALIHDLPIERVTFTAVVGSIEVHYANAHFRCEQPVEALVASDGAGFKVLVQPVEMDPLGSPLCDCNYDLDLSFAAARGAHTVSVYRRWDNLSQPNDPVFIGSGEVTVP